MIWGLRGITCFAAVFMFEGVVTNTPSLAQTGTQLRCTGNSDIPWDQQIVDCTNAIQSKKFRNSPEAYYNRGIAYNNKGDQDRAIADYNEAIRLKPKYAVAYNNRSVAYNAKGDFDRAVADANEAIRLDPKNAIAYYNRGNSYDPKGDHDRAIADYNEAIRLDPKFGRAYLNRGIAYFYGGSVPKALADLNQASELVPKYAYTALWLDIANERSKLPSRLQQAIAKIDMTEWPAPVIRLYLGQLTPAAVLAAADDQDAYLKQTQVCEANFYSGELALRQGAQDEAIRLFHLAASDCPKGSSEFWQSNAELKAMGAIRE